MGENPYLTPPNLNDVRETSWDEGYAACAAERDRDVLAERERCKAIVNAIAPADLRSDGEGAWRRIWIAIDEGAALEVDRG